MLAHSPPKEEVPLAEAVEVSWEPEPASLLAAPRVAHVEATGRRCYVSEPAALAIAGLRVRLATRRVTPRLTWLVRDAATRLAAGREALAEAMAAQVRLKELLAERLELLIAAEIVGRGGPPPPQMAGNRLAYAMRIASAMRVDADLARRVQVAVGQYRELERGLLDARRALAKGAPESELAKLRVVILRVARPLDNLGLTFRQDALVARLFPS